MAYCKYCEERIGENETIHNCRKKGLLNVREDDSFIVSTLIGVATDSAILGTVLGGSVLGATLGDVLDGDLFD